MRVGWRPPSQLPLAARREALVVLEGPGLRRRRQDAVAFFPPTYFKARRAQMENIEVTLADTDRPIHGYATPNHPRLTHHALVRPDLVDARDSSWREARTCCVTSASQEIVDRIPGWELGTCEEMNHFFLIQCFEESPGTLINISYKHEDLTLRPGTPPQPPLKRRAGRRRRRRSRGTWRPPPHHSRR
jgi:hypothetical protein